MMNTNMDEDNGKSVVMANAWYQKVWRFSSNEFWTNIGCLVSDPNFGLGGSRPWEKEQAQKISGNKRKRCSISMKVDLYDVCLPYSASRQERTHWENCNTRI